MLIELFEKDLIPSSYQFGFQQGSSTTMCSWVLLETVNYFRNRGGPVFVCLLDLSKAFDMVKLPILFKKLQERIPPLFLRFIIFSYINQQCSVLWQGQSSTSFTIGNGVRQGAVASPVFFNLYIDSLFMELKNSGCGCYVEGLFQGAVAYADDISLVSPTRAGLQTLIDICEKHFTNLGITISTSIIPEKSKTKVLYFGNMMNLQPLVLYNKVIPYVVDSKHLGHLIHTDESMDHDLLLKRRQLIGKMHSLRQELGNQDPHVYLKLIKVYILHLYGCQLWNFQGRGAEKLWSTWNGLLRSLFHLPLATHRYILEAVSGSVHLKEIVLRRFTKFHQKLSVSSNPLIRNLFRIQRSDMRSGFARNVCIAGVMQGVDRNPVIHPVPAGEEWRIQVVRDIASRTLTIQNLVPAERDMILQHICCS